MISYIKSVNDTGKHYFTDDWKAQDSDIQALNKKLDKIIKSSIQLGVTR